MAHNVQSLLVLKAQAETFVTKGEEIQAIIATVNLSDIELSQEDSDKVQAAMLKRNEVLGI